MLIEERHNAILNQLSKITDTKDIDLLITDSDSIEDEILNIEKQNVKVIIVEL